MMDVLRAVPLTSETVKALIVPKDRPTCLKVQIALIKKTRILIFVTLSPLSCNHNHHHHHYHPDHVFAVRYGHDGAHRHGNDGYGNAYDNPDDAHSGGCTGYTRSRVV